MYYLHTYIKNTHLNLKKKQCFIVTIISIRVNILVILFEFKVITYRYF